MLKRFLKDSAVYGASSILARGLSLFMVPIYTRVLSPGDYGVVDMLTVFATLMNLTIALEIAQGLGRYTQEARDASERSAYASTALWFTAAVYLTFLLAAIPASGLLSRALLGSAEHELVMRVTAVSIAVGALFYIAQTQLRWELRPTHFAISSIVYTLVSLAVAVQLVVVMRLGVLGVILGQLAGHAAGAGISLYFARRSYAMRFDTARLREMLRYSIPLVPSGIGVFVTLYIDRIALQRLMTLTDVGLFGIGYRVAGISGLLMVGFQGALTPLVFARYKEPGTPAELARIFRVFTALALLTTMALALFAPEILTVFTTPAYYGAALVVPLLAPALLLMNMYIFAPGLGIAKRTGLIAVVNVFGAILNTVLNFALIPLLGIRGAAAATLLSAVAVFVTYLLLSQRLYPIPHAWSRLLLSLGAASLVIWLGAGVGAGTLGAILLKTALLAVSAAVFVGFGLIQFAEVRQGWMRLSSMRLAPRAGTD